MQDKRGKRVCDKRGMRGKRGKRVCSGSSEA